MAEPGPSNTSTSPGPRTVTLTAAMVIRLQEHSRKNLDAADSAAVAVIREGIQLAVELLRLPSETPIDPNPDLEHQLVDVRGQLDQAEENLRIADAEFDALAMAVRVLGNPSPLPPQPEQYRPKPEADCPAARSTKYPDPPMFSGRDCTQLRPFIAKLRLKLYFNRDWYVTEQQRLEYAIKRLEDLALGQILPYVEEHHLRLKNLAALITILENVFGDPDRAATAERELNKLRQTNREFSLYYAEFQRLIAELDYNDTVKKNTLRRGLSEELKDALAYNPNQPEDFEQFVNLCNRLDNQIRARKAEKRGEDYRPRLAPTAAPRTAPVIAPAPTPPPHPTNTKSGHYGVAPMDHSANCRRNTPEERQKCMAEGRCLSCHGYGHFARECPHRGRRTNSRAPVYANQAVVALASAGAAQAAEPSGNGANE